MKDKKTVKASGSEMLGAGTRMDINTEAHVSANDIFLDALPDNPGKGMKLGNGDIGVSVYQNENEIFLNIGKNDILDYRNVYDDIRPKTHKDFLDMYADKKKPHVQEYLMNGSRGFGEKGGIDDTENMYIGNLCETVPMPSAKPAGLISIKPEGCAFYARNNRSYKYLTHLSLYNARLLTDTTDGLYRFNMSTPYTRNLIITECCTSSVFSSPICIELIRKKDKSGFIDTVPIHSSSGRDMWFEYTFPPDRLNYPLGFCFAVYLRIIGGNVTCIRTDEKEEKSIANIMITDKDKTVIVAAVYTSRESQDPAASARKAVEEYCANRCEIENKHNTFWKTYWECSMVNIPEKPFLMRQWYSSQYLLASSWKPGCEPPGLYGPWIWQDKPPFGNDLHWDYNIQQAIWAAFSSNHLEQTLPYYATAVKLLPTAKTEASEVYGLDGAKFPLVSWPGKFDHSPYPVIHYDRMMSLNGWVAHPFWWYYLYSQDRNFLEKTAYPLMMECAIFYEGYLTLCDDGKYDIWPTAIWDMHLSTYLLQNKNCISDIAFIKYLLNACAEAGRILGVDGDKCVKWREIADNLREYPTEYIEKGKYAPVDMIVGGIVPIHNEEIIPEGKVFVTFEGKPVVKYNLLPTTTVVFPCDNIGLDSPDEYFDTAYRTIFSTPYYLCDDLVMLTMARIRLGSDTLDLYEKLTRRLSLENGGLGIIADMSRIWLNCCGWPIVINESILQSYTGILRINPVGLKKAVSFVNLRTCGAFLVSGEIRKDGYIPYITIKSEAGCRLKMHRPWTGALRIRTYPNMQAIPFSETCVLGDEATDKVIDEVKNRVPGKAANGVTDVIVEFETTAGGIYVIDHPERPWEVCEVTAVGGK